MRSKNIPVLNMQRFKHSNYFKKCYFLSFFLNLGRYLLKRKPERSLCGQRCGCQRPWLKKVKMSHLKKKLYSDNFTFLGYHGKYQYIMTGYFTPGVPHFYDRSIEAIVLAMKQAKVNYLIKVINCPINYLIR